MQANLRRLLVTALERKERFEKVRTRLDWSRSVYLIHPELFTQLVDNYTEEDSFALSVRDGFWHLFGVRLVADAAQRKQAAPELLVALDPSSPRRRSS